MLRMILRSMFSDFIFFNRSIFYLNYVTYVGPKKLNINFIESLLGRFQFFFGRGDLIGETRSNRCTDTRMILAMKEVQKNL